MNHSAISHTPTELGTNILKSARPAAAIPILECRTGLPLSFAQERLWFLAQMEGGSKAYQSIRGFHLSGELDRIALRQAFNQIVERHESLRTVFGAIQGKPVQRILDQRESQFRLIEHDLRKCDKAPEEFDRLIKEEANTTVDVAAGPLIRARLIRQSEHDHVLLITIHHIVSDLWSFGIFCSELSVLYGAWVRGEANPLPALSVQYADYSVWQRKWLEGQILEEQAEYWKTALAGAPPLLQLPTDHIRPAQQTYSGASLKLVLDEALSISLKSLGKRHGTTQFVTMLAGWGALLARLSGQQDIVIGTPMANRRRVQIERLIGFFVNTVPLRLQVLDSLSVSELLAQVRSQAVGAQKNQDIPFEHLVDLARPARTLSHNPVFQVMFAWQNGPQGTFDLPGLEVSLFSAGPHTKSKFDLTLSLQEEGSKIIGDLEYATDLFEQATAERYLSYFRMLLEAMAFDDTQEVGRFTILPDDEREQLLYEWNLTEAQYPREKCVHELFEEQAEKTPDAVAVVFENDLLSYAELNRRANHLGHYLRKLGVGPEVRVGICMERSVEMVIGLLGILKAGGAYVPLDPGYPAERLAYMLREAQARVVLVETGIKQAIAECETEGINIKECGNLQEESASNLSRNTAPENLAYIIYTSGSTGKLKGVAITHGNLSNHMNWMLERYPWQTGDAVLQKTSISFDAAGWEFYAPLLSGGRLVLPAGGHHDIVYLIGQIRSKSITILQVVPSVLHLLLQESDFKECKSLRYLFCGGEALTVDLVNRLWSQLQIEVVNLYGPTEATIDAAYWSTGPTRIESLPIGRPVANTQAYVLDDFLNPVPVGVIGELYLGGEGLARGYWGQSALSAERFLPNPFGLQPGGRMYRTGDQVRWRREGELEFLGRNDFQVKIRGFRIELGEIEARLKEQEEIKEAVVVVREDEAGEKRLVAYYTVVGEKEGEGGSERERRAGVGTGVGVGVEELRQHLLARLPEYMVPAAYVRLEALPLTANGKLDRKGLPGPGAEAYGVREYEAPEGETEEVVAGIWRELLHVERVGRGDNFFELGGHSLLAVRVIARVRKELGVGVKISEVFAHPTLAGLAGHIVNVQLEQFDAGEIGELLKQMQS